MEDLIRAEVFEPLGMNACGFGAPAQANEGDQPLGHRRGRMGENRAVQPGRGDDNPPSLGPAGTVHCTLDGWLPFAALHAGSGPPGYLAPATLATYIKRHHPACMPADGPRVVVIGPVV